jgi:hypothetical protein
LSTGTSESSIIFFNGGHNHNGTSSALIDVSKYSLYDFTTDFLGTQARKDGPQANNYGKFKEVVARIVKEDVLTTAGITLLPQQVKAENISAGAVTATSLAANIVLVNNVIRSNNFDGTVAANGVITSQGTSGWAITSAGSAAFSNTAIRGTLTAGAVSTPGIDIDSNGNLTANTFALYGNGAIVTSSGNFAVDAGGNLYAENATIYGEINATSGSVSGDLISGGTISGVDLVLSESGIETSINVPFNFGGNAYTFIVKEIAAPLNSVRIAPGKVIVTNPSDGISLDMTNGIFSTLPIQSTSTVEMETGYVNGIGITYPGCTTGPGTANYMGLVWDNPDIRGTVDNVVSAVLGTVSDVRSKSYILNAEDTWLNKIYDSLRVVSFNPVDLLDEENLHLYPRRLGLIAQELNEVLPDLVVSANPYDEEAFLSVNYLGLVPYLIQAVQDLNNRVKELESKV